jgi:hypothetical protein
MAKHTLHYLGAEGHGALPAIVREFVSRTDDEGRGAQELPEAPRHCVSS